MANLEPKPKQEGNSLKLQITEEQQKYSYLLRHVTIREDGLYRYNVDKISGLVIVNARYSERKGFIGSGRSVNVWSTVINGFLHVRLRCKDLMDRKRAIMQLADSGLEIAQDELLQREHYSNILCMLNLPKPSQHT